MVILTTVINTATLLLQAMNGRASVPRMISALLVSASELFFDLVLHGSLSLMVTPTERFLFHRPRHRPVVVLLPLDVEPIMVNRPGAPAAGVLNPAP